jgi:hypothetical protein
MHIDRENLFNMSQSDIGERCSPQASYFYHYYFFLALGMKDKDKHKYPMLTQENKELADNIADTVIGCMIRGRNSFLKTAQEIVSLNRQWKDQSV